MNKIRAIKKISRKTGIHPRVVKSFIERHPAGSMIAAHALIIGAHLAARHAINTRIAQLRPGIVN